MRVAEFLEELGTLTPSYEQLALWEEQLQRLNGLFSKAVGHDPWGAQRLWARRVVMGRSFALVAPTGSGKTTFGLVAAVYTAMNGRKAYLIFPTKLLVQQAYSKLEKFLERLGLTDEVKALAYHADLSRKQASEARAEIAGGRYHILLSTSSFLARRFDLLDGQRFGLVFVDDVDALLKRSKNVDRVLRLLGFPQEIIDDALRIVDLRLARRGREEGVSKAVEEARRRIREFLQRNSVGILLVSSASIRAGRTKRVKLFKELLGFEVGSRLEMRRNVVDLYVKPADGDVIREAVRLVRKLGDGGLLFVPVDRGIGFAEELAERIREVGLKVGVYGRGKDLIEGFRSGDVNILVGLASHRSPLARGLDLPQRVRYAIFAGVPKLVIDLDVRREFSPYRAMILLARLRWVLPESDGERAYEYMARLRRTLISTTPAQRRKVIEAMRAGLKLSGRLGMLQRFFEDVLHFLEGVMAREDVRAALKANPHLSLVEREGCYYLIVPDTVAYIQASGRTSRMYAGGVSRGLSVVVVDDDVAFCGLTREVKWFAEEVEWRPLSDAVLESVMAEVDRDREFIRRLLRGEAVPKQFDPIRSALLVVESPTKAKTIARFFGRPSKRRVGNLIIYEVSTGDRILGIAASGGHVFDLATEPGLYGVLVDGGAFTPVYAPVRRCRKCGESFTTDWDACPACGSAEFEEKIEAIRSLRDAALEVDEVYIGTDADAEGEKIGWDLAQALSPYASEVKRIEFHEVTRRALLEALQNPRSIDLRLVRAQIVRRVEDRWIGFALSEKLRERFGRRELSAGRVQTPVLGWVIRRSSESKRSLAYHYEVKLGNGLKFVLKFTELTEDEAKELERTLMSAKYRVDVVEDATVRLNPPPPYTTDTMLRDACRVMHIGADAAMRLAQDLFEAGLITYHRTDSTRVSGAGLALAREYITQRFGENAYQGRTWTTGREGAHECIRPTRPLDAERLRELLALGRIRPTKPLTKWHQRLYSLVFRRFIASQMRPAEVVRRSIRITSPEAGVDKLVEGYVDVREPGFTRLTPIKLMPEVKEGVVNAESVRHWRAPTVRPYTQGELIGEMKLRGIGRPSTYARTVRTLFRRGYVREVGRGYLIPTGIGVRVHQYLSRRFGEHVSEDATRRLSEVMEKVGKGEVDYSEVLSQLYEEIMRIRAEPP